jgi:nucleotide-binding universal stress UspA family protein
MFDTPDPTTDGMTVLVPVQILEGEQVPAALISVLASTPVVLLGYHVIPEQTAPEQARASFGDQALEELDDLAAAFRDAGGSVETRLVFTRNPTQTFERVAVDEAVDAILLLNPAPSIDRVMVALSEGINTERITELATTLARGSGITVSLVHVATAESERERGEQLLDDARGALVDKGISPGWIDSEVLTSETPIQAIIGAASGGTDLVVLGESRPSVRELVFGEPSERIAEHSLAPILVVRRLPALSANGVPDSGVDEDGKAGDGDERGGAGQ